MESAAKKPRIDDTRRVCVEERQDCGMLTLYQALASSVSGKDMALLFEADNSSDEDAAHTAADVIYTDPVAGMLRDNWTEVESVNVPAGQGDIQYFFIINLY